MSSPGLREIISILLSAGLFLCDDPGAESAAGGRDHTEHVLPGYDLQKDLCAKVRRTHLALQYCQAPGSRRIPEILESPELDEAAAVSGGRDPADAVEDKETALQIHLILHDLPEPYKEVFQLRVFGELPFSQIGFIFGKTENWARVTYHRARMKIQERMEKHG